MSTRREFITLLGGAAAAWPLVAAADARPRLAFLTLGPQQNVHLAFVDGLLESASAAIRGALAESGPHPPLALNSASNADLVSVLTERSVITAETDPHVARKPRSGCRKFSRIV
jgi:hypothetical protein